MRILVISPYFPPRNAIGALRVHAFCTAWAAGGEEITVLTTTKRDHQRGAEVACDGFEVVEIDYWVPHLLERLRHALRTPPPEGGGESEGNGRMRHLKAALRRVHDRTGIFGSTRMPDFTDRWVKPAVAWALAKPAWDVVFSSAGPYTAHLVAMALKQRRRALSWVAEYRDLWVGNSLHRGLFPFTVRERWLERRCLRQADLLVTISEPLAGILRRRSGLPVEVIYNGFDHREVDCLPQEPIFPDDDLVRVVFTGTVYPAGQNPAPFFGALAALHNQSPAVASRLRLVVAGPTGEVWAGLADRYGVANLLEDRGTVSRADARRMQRDAAALLLVDFDSSVPGVLTGKIFEYLGVRAPILVVGGAAGSPIADLILRSGRGLHLAHDDRRIQAALRDLLAARPPMSVGPDREFIETLTRQHQAQRLHRKLVELVEVRS